MSIESQHIIALIAFALLMTFINMKAGSSPSGTLVKWITFILLLATIVVLTYKVVVFVL